MHEVAILRHVRQTAHVEYPIHFFMGWIKACKTFDGREAKGQIIIFVVGINQIELYLL
ncbi:Uncharacterised protein [Vibrio cholerae]|uniref:Uncharacterized protein n=1 Tax=Vibrio cholerae TaxID=666 RepID=A0A655RBF0_VIBCL|nr:Uncharacterised protein [Vibrio cholerae]CRZ95936.1 Uncharacterised protein [Vibrio cholerae]CSA95330.1 Uncharacterised protein [Vibrio cholerae]CSB23887.1 Uncharacterised protein [Vibrio cholerae]CSB49338.1 Uncharacterised protein [Vibrio cholerae]